MKQESLVNNSVQESLYGKDAGILSELNYLLSPNADFLRHKYLDHRSFTIIITVVLSVLWASLWLWDYVTDPIGAKETVFLRLLYLSAISFSVLLYYIRRPNRWLSLLFVSGMLAAEMNFILILNYLDSGEVFGLAGFMYCMFIAVLTLQSFSLRANVTYTLLACLLPHLASMLNILRDFHHDHYAALIWPAAALAILAQTVQSHHYLLRYRLEKRLEVSAITDPLTGVKNRRFFMPVLEKEITRVRRLGRSLSVLMLDIDHFKNVNDTYGHQTGDLVICDLSFICVKVAREIDVVARYGGEEFVILLTECNQDEAVKVAERIRSLVESQSLSSIGGQVFSYTVSLGVAELLDSDAKSVDLISRVDHALYTAKQHGRNRVMPATTQERVPVNIA
jgi:diguanylate cyclase (GGDEF)-like protein